MKTELNYKRVMPRDLFNEAKLLKCMGLLIVCIQDEITPAPMSHNEPDEFVIGLREDGTLCVVNLTICVKRKPFRFHTTYNSKSNYPLFVEHMRAEYRVFNEQGEWDEEFIEFCKLI